VVLQLSCAPGVALAAPGVVAPPAVALAGTSARIPPLVAYGDSQSNLPRVPLATALSGLPACARGAVAEPTFARALADAHRLFRGSAARGEKKLAAARYSGTAGRAEVFAAGAVVARAPEAGLAALLDAQHHAARNPMLLVDASVFLTELGHPADALALVDHASRLGRVKGAPLGLNDRAAELNDRGFALLGMHRYAAALTALQAAKRAGGRLLSEASINEALALDCTGKRDQAGHPLVAGAYRQTYDLVDDAETSGPGTQQQPPPGQLGFTRPDGPPDTTPPLKYPTSEFVADSAYAGFGALGTFLLDQVDGFEQQRNSQYLKLLRQLRHASPLTRQRTNEILQLMSEAGPNEPALTKTSDAASKAENNINAFLARFSGQQPPSACGHHGQWLSLIQTWDTKIRQYVAAASKYEAPLLANLGNPLAHEVALDGIRMGDDLELDLLVNDVISWTSLESFCKQHGTVPAPADQGTKAGDPGPCPELLAPNNKLVLKIPNFIDIKVNCESVEGIVEGEGLVAPFVSGERTVHGETTILGGAKVGIDLGPFSGVELQEGFCIKSGPSGIEDWGVRVSPSASGGAGPVLIEFGSSVDISLVGSVSYTPAAFGFR
jgi:hypothetical protein